MQMTKRDITLRDQVGSFAPEEGMRVWKEHSIHERNWNPYSKRPAAYSVVLTGSLHYKKNPGRWEVQWDNGFETPLKEGDRICR